MDQFVALTERYGLKPRGKSAPMAALKRSVFNPKNGETWHFGSGDDVNAELTSWNTESRGCSKKLSTDESGFDAAYLFTVMPESISSLVNAVDDLLGDFTAAESLNDDASDDELIPGFGGNGQPSNSEFQETEAVEAKAIADINSRDRQLQIEQDERSRISETIDAEIKLWAAGKEGNMRALLSSLHLVLWPGCEWEAVSLTDLITSAAVKKVYRKANLYVHPDKVQQKGAQQKYIAEKVFNILQEAWNKFNKEELS